MSTSTQAGVWVSATDAVLSYDYQIQSPGPMEVQIKSKKNRLNVFLLEY